MQTKCPTLVDLTRLANVGDAAAAGSPRVLVLLPDDGGRLIVTLNGGGNTVARTIEADDGPTLREAGEPEWVERFEPFYVNGIPYRFHTYWYDRERTGIPGHYVDRLDVTMGGATDNAKAKSRALAVDAMAFVEGARPTLAEEADRREGLRRVERIDEKLAELAKEAGALLDERDDLTADPMPRVSFSGGRAVLTAVGDFVITCHSCGTESDGPDRGEVTVCPECGSCDVTVDANAAPEG